MSNVMIATPAYDGKLPIPFVISLLNEQQIFQDFNQQVQLISMPSCSVPAHGRNALCKWFLGSGFDQLIFVDADVTWELGNLFRLSMYPEDIVAGAYRFKREQEFYPVEWLDHEFTRNEHKLIEVAWAPTGFMKIRRQALLTFMEKHPDRYYIDHGEAGFFCFFQMVFKDGEMHSDDVYFCKEWRQAGGKIHLCPDLTLTHWDFNTPYPGNIAKWIEARSKQKGDGNGKPEPVPVFSAAKTESLGGQRATVGTGTAQSQVGSAAS